MLHCVGGDLSWICAAVNREIFTMNTFVGGDDEVKTMKLVKEGFHHHKILALWNTKLKFLYFEHGLER